MPPARRNPTLTFQTDEATIERLDALVRQLQAFRPDKKVRRSQVVRAAIYQYAQWCRSGTFPRSIMEGLE